MGLGKRVGVWEGNGETGSGGNGESHSGNGELQWLVMLEVQFRTPHRTVNSRTTPLHTKPTGVVQAQANITCSWFG